MIDLSGPALLAYTLILLGLIGSILPLIPGPLLIWLGALLWAWNDGFGAVGWPTLAVLGVLTVVAWSLDLVLTTLTTRRAGAGWKAVVGAIAGGLAGGLLLGGFIPVCGTIVATVAGAIAGILAVEYLEKRDWSRAFAAARGYIFGFLVASALEVVLALAMIGIFAWQAFA